MQVCAAGGRVVYVDVENDGREMAERLKLVASQWDAEQAVRDRPPGRSWEYITTVT